MEITNLSGIRLKDDVKNALADLVINKVMKSKDVAEQFRISVNRVRYYTFRRRISISNHNNPGRVRIIDKISHNNIIIQLFLGQENILNKLKSIIKEEGKNSYSRRHPNMSDTDKRKSLYISHRSINRYYDIYLNILQNNERNFVFN